MSELAAQFEVHRPRLRGIAYRMLGSAGEAEEAVQDTWLRLSRTDASAIDNLGGWLTTTVARVCLNLVEARRTRSSAPEVVAMPAVHTPEDEAMLADSVGLALQVVLDTLPPAERVAFVLHELFEMPFEEIASIVGRSSTATRQLASRARRRVRGAAVRPDAPTAARRHRRSRSPATPPSRHRSSRSRAVRTRSARPS